MPNTDPNRVRPYLIERNQRIVADVRRGLSIGFVAREQGLTRQRVSQIIHMYGLRIEKSRDSRRNEYRHNDPVVAM